MVKNKSRLAIKLFVIVWVVLAIHIALKLTFSYWQPYVIPNETLQSISNFIDNNRWIEATLDSLFYVFNGYVVICCCLQVWNLKKKTAYITIVLLLLGYLWVTFIENTIIAIVLSIVYPLILNRKKWLYVILAFVFNNLFLALSLWLTGFVSTNEMDYIIGCFFTFDYYIMMVLCYFVFNFIRKENKNGK